MVTNAYGSATTSVTLFPLSDTLIPLPGGLYVAGVILTPGGGGAYGNGTYDIMGPVGTFSFPTRPVKQGETLVLYGTGFGPTKPTLPAGVPYSGAGAPAVDSIGVSLNGVNASVLFAGAVSPGLFQFNVVLPNTGPGNWPISVTVTGPNSSGGSSGYLIAVE